MNSAVFNIFSKLDKYRKIITVDEQKMLDEIQRDFSQYERDLGKYCESEIERLKVFAIDFVSSTYETIRKLDGYHELLDETKKSKAS
jgi:hypothetical protein